MQKIKGIKMIISIKGELEIDQERGVIYFHSNEGYSLLRISSLPKPIPNPQQQTNCGKIIELPQLLDITHMYGVSWNARMSHQRPKIAKQ
jgi:hypothetical protein